MYKKKNCFDHLILIKVKDQILTYNKVTQTTAKNTHFNGPYINLRSTFNTENIAAVGYK